MKKCFALHIILFWSILLHSSFLFCGQKITASGISFFEPGRELIAREKALNEAKRAAIEQVVGAHIRSTSIVENFQLVQDQIFSQSSGYLKNLKILKEKKTNLGTYEVVIEAEVEVSELVNDIERFKSLLSLQKNPSVFIQINPAIRPEIMAAAVKTKNLLADRLQKAGFLLLASKKTDETPGPSLILDLGIEISTTKSAYQDITITLNEINLFISIIRPSENKILATASVTTSIPGENRLQILDRGAQKCVAQVWGKLRKKLLSVWEKELYGPREIILVIDSLNNYNEAKQINEILKTDIHGVVNAQLLKYRGKTAVYVVKFKGWPDFLINEMSMSYFQNKYFSFTIEKLEGNKIVIKIDQITCKK